ncbi:hypothetical protein [Microbispora sp. NBC_01389]|uniref:hypothetical protein n=1 Tax=Microbispora sp. NBC_01389 TaxID=2903584 RepID=UPI0032539B00
MAGDHAAPRTGASSAPAASQVPQADGGDDPGKVDPACGTWWATLALALARNAVPPLRWPRPSRWAAP